MTARVDTVRQRVNRRGLRLVKRGNTFELRDGDNSLHCGSLDEVAAYLSGHCPWRGSGGVAKPEFAVPPQWAGMIDDYLISLAAVGQRETTIDVRRDHLSRIARGLGCPPEAVTGELLVDWFGRQTHWALETRRGYRSASRGFFAWAYKTGRVSVYLGDEISKVRQIQARPRPAPDQAWRTALIAADTRVTLMVRLAGEAGLRRAEVAQVHYRDLIDGVDGAQLLVHGKGGKKRVVPLSDSLAGLLRLGAAGHTPGQPVDGWLFPTGPGGHLTPHYVGELVDRVLPDGYTMHTLRHRFATRAYRGTRNLRAVQVLLGHASIATTERYVAVDDSEIRAAMMAASDQTAGVLGL
jgi:integrase/recombinase XerC